MREILLNDRDYSWVTYGKAQVAAVAAKPVKPGKFDSEACLERLAKKVKSGRWGVWDFSDAELSPNMSKEEARFWLESMFVGNTERPKAVATALAKKADKLKPITLENAIKALKKNGLREPPREIGMVLTPLFGAKQAAEILFSFRPETSGTSFGGVLFHSVREYVIPHLSDAEKNAIKKRIAKKVTPKNFPSDIYDEPPVEFLYAVLLGMHDELETLVSSWTDPEFYQKKDYFDAYHAPQIYIFGLGSRELVIEHMTRLKLRFRCGDYMRAWLAHTQYDALDHAAQGVLRETNKDVAGELASVLALVHAPENAGPMLEIAMRSKAQKVGADWMTANVEHAAKGLAEVATTGKGTLATAAATRLQDLKRAGHGKLIEKSAGGAAKEKLAAIEAKETKLSVMKSVPSWLAKALKGPPPVEKLKPVTWLDKKMLPNLDVEGSKLGPEHVEALIHALAASPLDGEKEPHPLVTAIKEHSPEASRDAFAWRIFEDWMAAGASSKEKWALGAVGHLGGDASALKLAPLVRGWPGESQHQRAVFGLDVLGAIGSDIALVQLSGIAQKVKFQALKRRAGEAMERIAKARKMSRDQLEDRIVPDGGFGPDGKRVLSFGARSFEVVLGKEGAPAVKDAEGKVRADLPAAGKQDDAAIAAQSIAEWKTLKKGLREATKIQIERLEQAMVKGRAWSVKDFETLLLKHPLMSHLIRTLVWGAFSDKGKLTATFRVAEDGTLADQRDDAFKLPKSSDSGVTVSIVHPLDLDAATKDAWGAIFGDYKIIAPFPQLGRPVHALQAKNEKTGDDLGARFKGQEWGVTAFIGKLRRRGWLHGSPQDAGFVYEHRKAFFNANVTAVIEHTGYPIGSLEYADAQKIEHLYFYGGTDESGYGKKHLKLGSVDAKAISEVIYDLL